MRKLSYRQSIKYIYSFSDYETTHKLHDSVSYDLRRVEELMGLLGNPHLKAKSVHIAGTKGKGSVAAMVSSVLTASGYKTGLYISPHLIDIRERFQIGGNMISEAEFTDIIDEIKSAVDAVNRLATYGLLTTFEIMTALCFVFFTRHNVDFRVVEVGLGGRLDATNVITPDICVITPVNLDHTDVLGDTIAKIAAEKAGIIKEGIPVVSAPQPDEAMRIIEDECLVHNSPLIKVGTDIIWQEACFNPEKLQLAIKGRLNDYRLSIPLVGCCQMENAATAVAALEVLIEKGFNISPLTISEGMTKIKWLGRFQVMGKHPLIVIDGAHNVLSARELKKSLLYYYVDYFPRAALQSEAKTILVFGASADKDVKGMIKELAPLFDEIIVTRSRHPRSMEISRLASEFENMGIEVKSAADVAKAIELAKRQALNKALICISGSLFIAGDAIAYLTVD
ncbi:MAG TPA: bifunctional folylpolyglutamate synthase/dihydrofolate synthase [Dehalococcoidia bacterium]|nr:bifunctional folylpolyglutamate synthase/dihydrofolate synthase [Dehalococcoidia bacterium]